MLHLSRRLHAPKIWIECEVRDKDGKLIDKRRFRGMSWVGRIVELFSCIVGSWGSSGGNYPIVYTKSDLKDTGGTYRHICFASSTSGMPIGGNAPAGETTAGICVGSSDTPVSIDQYNLVSKIPHGSGAGQLLYGSSTAEDIVRTSNTFSVKFIRTFTNNSGETVTVREIGLFIRLGMYGSPHGYSCMLARDVLPTPIDIPNGATLTVRYIISHTV